MAIRLNLLGGFEARVGDAPPAAFTRRKAQALLAYLARHPDQPQPRDKLASLLWGDVPSESARQSLRQAVSAIRQAVGSAADGALQVTPGTITLDSAAVAVDVTEFERRAAVGTPEALAEAADLYRGELLAGLEGQEPAYEEWLATERGRLSEVAIEVLARLLAQQLSAGEVEGAIRSAARLLAVDPLQEAVHRTLMRLHAGQGRRGTALRQYQVCVATLARELGAEPEDETRLLYREILQGRSASLPAATIARETGATVAPHTPSAHETRLIGRDAEMTRLRQVLGTAGRPGRAAVILGEAGIGKTRLVEEVSTEIQAAGWRVLVARAHESEQMLPLGLWVDALRAGGVVEWLGDEGALDRPWRAELARLFPELGASVTTSPPSAQDYVRLFEAVARLLQVVADDRPLLILLEDLHWADEMSVRLLPVVIRRTVDHRVAVVATVRDEELADAPALRRVLGALGREDALVSVPLAPLSRPDTVALVESLAPAGRQAGALAQLGERIWTASEGNPFAAVEAMRAVREHGVEGAEAVPALPARVRDAIEARLGRLDGSTRDLVAVLAVAGRATDFSVLHRAAGLEPGVAAEAVEHLVERRILHVVGERLDLIHDRIRSVAYERLLPPRRRLLHGAVAGALEALHGGALDDVVSQLAFHHARGEQPERAVPYLVRFAERAAVTYAYADAVAALDEALGHLARGHGDEVDRQIVELALRQAFHLSILGRFAAIVSLLERERSRLERLHDAALEGPYLVRLGLTETYLGRLRSAAACGVQALAAAEQSGDDDTAGRALYVQALTSYYTGDMRRVADLARRAAECLAATRERHWLGISLWLLGGSLIFLGEVDEALDAVVHVERLGESTRDARLTSFAAWTRGWALATRGEFEAGVEACRQAVALAADPPSRWLATGRLGWVHLQAGDAAVAAPLLAAAAEASGGADFQPVAAQFAAVLAEACVENGEHARAVGLASTAQAASREVGFAYGMAVSARALGRVALAEKRLDEARAEMESALSAFTTMEAPYEVARTHMMLAEHAAAAGDRAALTRHLGAARVGFQALRAPRLVQRVEALTERFAG